MAGNRVVRRSVTLRDVAAAARVHVATASRALESRLEGADYMALMTETRDDSQVLERAVGHLLARQVDALVMLAVRSGDRDRVVAWSPRVPVVLAVRGLPGSGVPAVTHDDLGGARRGGPPPGEPRPPRGGPPPPARRKERVP